MKTGREREAEEHARFAEMCRLEHKHTNPIEYIALGLIYQAWCAIEDKPTKTALRADAIELFNRSPLTAPPGWRWDCGRVKRWAPDET